ncbi:hypothetical protein ACRAWD_21995 [Caulobacter segnis]
MRMETEPALFVGVDWASTEHQVCVLGPDGPIQKAFAHEAEGLGAMVGWLCSQTVTLPSWWPWRSRRRKARLSKP